MADKPVTRNQLSRKEFFALGIFLGQKEAAFAATKSQPEEIAQKATKELGFTVNARNVRRCAHDLGMTQKLWPNVPQSGSIMVRVHERLDKLEKELAELKAKLGEK